MWIISIDGLRRRVIAFFIAVLVIAALCWSVPRFYGLLTAETEEDFEDLGDPVRVEIPADAENTADWLNEFSK